MNVDQKPQVAGAYAVQSIPTIMMFRQGEGIMRLTGAHPYDSIKTAIEKKKPKSV